MRITASCPIELIKRVFCRAAVPCRRSLNPAARDCRPTGDSSSQLNWVLLPLLLVALPCSATEAPAPLSHSINKFACDYYRVSAQEGKNAIFSPFNLSEALSMAALGASGETESQMLKVLGLGPDRERTGTDWMNLRSLVTGAVGKENQLRSTASLWLQREYPIKPDYLALVESHFKAKPQVVNFAADPEVPRAAINQWVSRETEAMIPELLPSGSLDGLTRLVLANAIFFKGLWEDAFDVKLTRPRDFYLSPEKAENRLFMHRLGKVKISDEADAVVGELPYKGGGLSMFLVVPKALDGLKKIEATLGPEIIEGWARNVQERPNVSVILPKFQFSAGGSCMEGLEKLGMTLAFDVSKADLSRLTALNNLYISDVVHQARVEVDEKGTKAAAATAVGIAGRSIETPPPEPFLLQADRPFLFLILDRASKTVLFMGRVTDPVQ
jgi:serpin B